MKAKTVHTEFMTVRPMVEYLCLMSGKSKASLAKEIGMSQQQFEYRLKTGKFSIEEWKRIGNALNLSFQLRFTPYSVEDVAPMSVEVEMV